MERQSKGSRSLEAYFKGGHRPPRAVEPPKRKKENIPKNLHSGKNYMPGANLGTTNNAPVPL
jgi:hypothetical protein